MNRKIEIAGRYIIMEQTQIGPLNCVVVDGGSNPTIPVVLCHGFGAPGSDLVPIGQELLGALGPLATQFRFVFPEAPVSLADEGIAGGRAWWRLNMQRLMQLFQANDFSELRTEVPPGIDEARDALTETINEVVASIPDAGPLVIGGFSQGAMVTLDTALRGLETPPAAICQFSGTLICESIWKESAARLKDTVVVQTHGTMDSVLPFVAAEWLRDTMKESAKSWTFESFDGPHTIPLEAYKLTLAMLMDIANGA